MKNKKVLFSIILSLILALSILGCNDKSKNVTTTTGAKSINLNISAAASLKEVMDEIQPLFIKKYPNTTLTFNFGSSGSLQQQIEQGSPTDVFISAGEKQMTALVDGGFILDKSNKNLVQNTLVLVSLKNSKFTSLDDLTSDSVMHIAMGEPESVPAGKYANEVLTNLNILPDISSKLVFAKDVKEVLAWTASGNAELGFVYLSDAISSDSVKIISNIPENLHSPIIYPIGIIKSSENIEMAKKFSDFLSSDEGSTIFKKYGYIMLK